LRLTSCFDGLEKSGVEKYGELNDVKDGELYVKDGELYVKDWELHVKDGELYVQRSLAHSFKRQSVRIKASDVVKSSRTSEKRVIAKNKRRGG
jgi:hypothetical protein